MTRRQRIALAMWDCRFDRAISRTADRLVPLASEAIAECLSGMTRGTNYLWSVR